MHETTTSRLQRGCPWLGALSAFTIPGAALAQVPSGGRTLAPAAGSPASTRPVVVIPARPH